MKEEIKKRGSINSFANKNNFNKSSLHYLLNKDVNGKLSYIWAICDKLNISLSEIIEKVELKDRR